MTFDRKYNWERWTDGRVWFVSYPEDFTCTVGGFASQLYLHCTEERGVVVKTFPFDNVIVFRYYDRASEWKPNLPYYKEVQKLIARHSASRKETK